MRRLLNVFSKVEPRSRITTDRSNRRRFACVVAVGGALALTQAFAEDPAKPEARPLNKLQAASAAAPAGVAALPECLEKLKLSQPQQAQARGVISKYEASIDAVWKQFGEKYMETIRTEVALLAAVEDNLTEPQRTKVRDMRRKTAHAELALAGTSTKPNQATDKPADPVEQEVSGAGISLTTEQEAAADKIQQKYVSHLRSLNRDIQGLHTRLVSLEADKLVELEKVLSKEQLAQLREGRQTMTSGPKVTSSDKASSKIE